MNVLYSIAIQSSKKNKNSTGNKKIVSIVSEKHSFARKTIRMQNSLLLNAVEMSVHCVILGRDYPELLFGPVLDPAC